MYAKSANLILGFLLLGAMACRADTRVAEKKVGGACPLLSAADIQAVQGETVSDMQGSERTSDALSTSQCFYRLPTFSKSVSLEVTRAANAGDSRAAKEFWERRFGAGREEEEREMAAERKMEKERGDRKGERKEEAEREEREGEEKDGAGPKPVPGLGDEAFWSGNQLNSSLYVRKNNVIVRLSIGGPEEQSAKVKKATTLAEQVLKRL
jgi:hypothetical protein